MSLLFSTAINYDSLRKIVVDSVYKSTTLNPIDLVNKVDSFYNNAWNKIVILISIIATVIGIIVPLLINHIQLKRNKEENDRLLKDIKANLEVEREAIKVELKTYIDNELQSFEKSLNKFQHATEGVAYHIQGVTFFEKRSYSDAFTNYVTALTCYLIGEDYSNFDGALEELIKCAPFINNAALESLELTYSEYCNVNKLVEKLEESQEVHLSNSLYKLKNIIREIKSRV